MGYFARSLEAKLRTLKKEQGAKPKPIRKQKVEPGDKVPISSGSIDQLQRGAYQFFWRKNK